jgi:hypothetical protein
LAPSGLSRRALQSAAQRALLPSADTLKALADEPRCFDLLLNIKYLRAGRTQHYFAVIRGLLDVFSVIIRALWSKEAGLR